MLEAGRTALTRGFDAQRCLKLIDRHRVTHTVLVPTMLHDILRLPDRDHYDCSSLRTVVVGAAAVPPRMLEEAIGALAPDFLPLYGMTESTAVGCALRRADLYPIDAHPPDRLLSIGTPSAGVEVQVVREDGSPVTPEGQEMGEVALRGENVVSRYWGDVLRTRPPGANAGSSTGDVATVDADRFLRLVDRKKDVIISGGTNVASREVEEVLLRHAAVEAVAVVGVPHERCEAVTAVVVVRNGATCSEDDVVAHARASLGAPKVPKRVLFVDELPTNVRGKS